MPSYAQSQLKSDVNAKIKGKIGVLIDFQSTLNQGVREAMSEIDFVTARRKVGLTPNLFSGLFGAYAVPTDLAGYKVISIQNQKWQRTPAWGLVPYEQFLRRQDQNTIAISDYDFIRKLYANIQLPQDVKTVVSNMDSLSAGGGTWGAFGGVENVAVGSDNAVEGSASIKFDISAAVDTTAGIVNSTLTPVDLSGFFNGDANGLVWAYIVSTTGLTNFIIRYGSDASNYFTKTVTTQADGTAFTTGWNLLNFNLATFTTTGTPVETAMDYHAIYMTKLTSKVSEVGYRFDYSILRRGEINDLYYYSSYGWQSNAGVYKENSTAASDVLNAGPEEYQIILAKCAELAAGEVDESKVEEKEAGKFEKLKRAYQKDHPSEALIMISTTVDFQKV